MKKNQSQTGFTLIEMLVVVAIIGLLSSVVVTSLAQTRRKARDSKRIEDLSQISKALELYYGTNNGYPNTSGAWWGAVGSCGGSHGVTGATGYVPNLAPTFIGVLPLDPKPSTGACSGYAYRSDGANYKLISNSVSGNGGPETFPASGQPFYDPARPTTAIMVTNNLTITSAW